MYAWTDVFYMSRFAWITLQDLVLSYYQKFKLSINFVIIINAMCVRNANVACDAAFA